MVEWNRGITKRKEYGTCKKKRGRNKARSGGIAVTSLDERVPELLGQDTSVVLDVDGLEDVVELELLVVHVPPEVVIADAAVAVAVAGPE